MHTIPVLLTAAIAAAPGPKEPAGKGGDSLEGKWQLVAVEEKGLAAGKPDEPETLTVKGGEMLFQRGTDDIRRVGFVIDTTRSPAHLDLRLGPKGVCHAIVRVEKDELVLCAGSNFNADEAGNRPKEFVTGPPEDRPQKGKLLFRYKRVKP
jgi:uncharacterized protein (TIGR03067 family)